MHRPIGLTAKIGVALVALVIALVTAEAALRVAQFEYHPLRIAPVAGDDWRYHHSLTDDYFVFDPYSIWRPKASFDIFNAQGYRGRELPSEKAPGTYRILAVGDSNTLGWNADGPNWPQYLEELLATDDAGISVTNGGVWGYTSFQGLRRLQQSLGLEPDMVLVSFGSNDALEVTITDAQYERRLAVATALGPSRLAQLALQVWDGRTYRNSESSVPRVPTVEYAENLREFVRLGAEHAMTIVFLTRPFIGDIPLGSWKSGARRNNRLALRIAEEAGLTAIDVYDAFAGNPEYFADESHFNEEGHRRAGRLIYEQIRPLIP